jgi:hypothetical protein
LGIVATLLSSLLQNIPGIFLPQAFCT